MSVLLSRCSIFSRVETS